LKSRFGLAVVPALLLAGCVSTAVAVVKAPFQIVGAGIDAVTTSQAEADRNRGRRERKHDEAEAKAAKEAENQRRKDERAEPYR
jgi:hypothetical protein